MCKRPTAQSNRVDTKSALEYCSGQLKRKSASQNHHKTYSLWSAYIKVHVSSPELPLCPGWVVYSGTQLPAPTQLLDRMHKTIRLLLSTFTHLTFSFGYLNPHRSLKNLKRGKKNQHKTIQFEGEKEMFYQQIGKSILRMLKTAWVPVVLAATHETSQTTRSLHDHEGNHWVHEKEVTQTEIHKGQHEWDRISAYSSFYMARRLH